MHMADALVSPAVGAVMYVASSAAAAYSIKKIREEEDFKKKIPTMGVMGALVFATQMINFTIPGTGSSGHLCGGILLTGILGPHAAFLSMIGVLLIQCLFFADGGLLALGGNIFNMAFYGCFIGSLIWKIVMKNGLSKRKIALYSIVGSVFTLQLGAFSVTIETLLSGVTELPFKTFLLAMLPIHLAIGFVEGLISMSVLSFIYEARPEMLWNEGGKSVKENRFSYRKTIAIITVMFVVVAGGISLLASSNPDGLEWSIEKITGDTEIESEQTNVYKTSDKIQEKTAVLPDYSFKNSESSVGTSVSGIVGCSIVAAFLAIFGYILKLTRKRKV